jgi:ribosome-associated protein
VSPVAQALPSTELVSEIERFALEKKAHDVLELDMRGLVGYTDFFLVCTGNTDRQTKAIHDAIHEGVKREHGVFPRRVEGLASAQWILMDYLDVVLHIFTPATREFYRLERLWGEAPSRAVGSGPVPAVEGGPALAVEVGPAGA